VWLGQGLAGAKDWDWSMNLPKCYVHLGKHGDLIILLPGFEWHYNMTGEKPVVMVSKEFAPTLDGCSYLEPWVTDLHWYGDCGAARAEAVKRFGVDKVCMPKWWDDPTFTPPEIRTSATKLVIHGKTMQVEASDYFSYMASQWKYAGFPKELLSCKPKFDRRNLEREAHHAAQIFKTKKPKLLYCLNTGGSSPFPFPPEVEKLIYEFQGRFELVNLMDIRLTHLFDLLGLMDRARFLVTTDTAILHLAGASDIPYWAFLQNAGGGSLPRGNCVGHARYAGAPHHFHKLRTLIETHEKSPRSHPAQALAQPAPA
jgi:hypothetical protein